MSQVSSQEVAHNSRHHRNSAAERAANYAAYRRGHTWIENSLAYADEDENLDFDWKLVGMFVPYVKRYKLPAILSLVLMVVYTILNVINPWLISLAIALKIGLSWDAAVTS